MIICFLAIKKKKKREHAEFQFQKSCRRFKIKRLPLNKKNSKKKNNYIKKRNLKNKTMNCLKATCTGVYLVDDNQLDEEDTT